MFYGWRLWALLGAGTMALGNGMALAQDDRRCEIVLQNANVFTGDGFERRDLHVANGRFVAEPPEGAQTVDAGRFTVMPPFSDMHTHMIDQPRPSGARGHAAYLDQGIYYLLNPNNVRFDDALATGPDHVDGVYTGGGLTKPGGHPVPLYQNAFWLNLDASELPGRAYHEIATAEDARAAVREVKRQGSTHVKLYLNHHETPQSDGLDEANFRAAAAEARAQGLYAVVHVNSVADFRLAVAEDVHALVHMPGAWPRGESDAELMLTPADAALAAKNGVFVVPTLAVGFNALFGEELENARRIWRHNLTLMKEAGVRIAAGADRGGASALNELDILHSLGIYSGAELLEIGTTNGIRLAFPDRAVGTLEPGQEASFIVVGYDPTQSWWSRGFVNGGMREGVTIRGNLFPESCNP